MKKTRLTYKKLTGAGRYATRAAVLLLGLASASISQAAYLPIPFSTTNYNADVIVENNATPVLKVVTSASVDNGSNNTANTWFEIGYDLLNPGNGLPAAGSTFTASGNANYSFKMAPSYSAPNGILIDTVVTSGTWTLTTPAAYTLLSFLGSGGNGGDGIVIRVNHQDGSFEVRAPFVNPDWFNGTLNVAYIAGGRCQNPQTFTTETDGQNPRLYFTDMTLTNTTSPVTSVVINYASGGAGSHNAFFAVSGATTPGGAVGPITVTGYTYDFIVEATAAHPGRVTSQLIVDGTNQWATSQSLDSDANTGNSFYELGYNFNNYSGNPGSPHPSPNDNMTVTGLPHPGTMVTNAPADHVYQMAPSYTTNDAIFLSSIVTNVSVVFNSPTNLTAVSLLAAGAGASTVTIIAHHQDNTLETNAVTVPDWFNESAPFVIKTGGRVTVENGNFDCRFPQLGDPRVFNCDALFLGDTNSAVVSLDLVYTNTGGRCVILGVSGASGSVPPIFTLQPVSTNSLANQPISFSTAVAGLGPFTYQWQKGTNGAFVNLSNAGNVSGATTTTLVINPANYFSDAADYRVIAGSTGGSSTSAVATASLVSTLTDVTQPGDPITMFGGTPFGDGPVVNAINDSLANKWGANVTIPTAIGCVVTPNVGGTLVTGLRFYTANDSPPRDPANYKLEGSLNSGANYTLIVSNVMTLPDGRNAAGGAPNPLSSFVREVSFPNTNGFTSYRLTFTQLKGGASQGSFQLGEVEFLGVTTNIPIIVSVPAAAKAFNGSFLSIPANVSGSPTPASRWQKQVGPNFVNLTDGGTISGSQTATLSINPVAFSDAGNYRVIATNTITAVTSAVVQVFIYDTNVDVTLPSDPITDFGNFSLTATTPSSAIDGLFSAFTSRGSSPSGNAGFPPWGTNVGLVITPQAGPTLVTGLRLYPGADGAVSDPADVKLEGSNNGGSSYATILPKTALSIPDDRNTDIFAPLDPTLASVQEILFANSQAYTSYRLTFEHLKDDSATYFISIGELELLGVPSASRPIISSTVRSGNNLLVSGSGGTPNGTLSVLTNANIAAPVAGWGTNTTSTFDGSGNFSLSLPINAANPRLFFLIKTP
jgi:hypothetical protein